MSDAWEILGIEATADRREIKRAYARRLKKTRPDDDPDGFRTLRAGYEQALLEAKWLEEEQEWEEESDWEPPAEVIDSPEPPKAEPPSVIEGPDLSEHLGGALVEPAELEPAPHGDDNWRVHLVEPAPDLDSNESEHGDESEPFDEDEGFYADWEDTWERVGSVFESDDWLSALDAQLDDPELVSLEERARFIDALTESVADSDFEAVDIRTMAGLSQRLDWATTGGRESWYEDFYIYASQCEGAVRAERHLEQLAEESYRPKKMRDAARVVLGRHAPTKSLVPQLKTLYEMMSRAHGPLWAALIPGNAWADEKVAGLEQLGENEENGGCGCLAFIFFIPVAKLVLGLIFLAFSEAPIISTIVVVLLVAFVIYRVGHNRGWF